MYIREELLKQRIQQLQQLQLANDKIVQLLQESGNSQSPQNNIPNVSPTIAPSANRVQHNHTVEHLNPVSKVISPQLSLPAAVKEPITPATKTPISQRTIRDKSSTPSRTKPISSRPRLTSPYRARTPIRSGQSPLKPRTSQSTTIVNKAKEQAVTPVKTVTVVLSDLTAEKPDMETIATQVAIRKQHLMSLRDEMRSLRKLDTATTNE